MNLLDRNDRGIPRMKEYQKHLYSLRSLGILCLFILLLIGCEDHVEAPQVVENLDVTQIEAQNLVAPQTEETQQIEAPIAKTPTVITGRFLVGNYSPRYSGTADVSQVGDNKYHLSIEIITGLSHHIGEIQSDFDFDGERFVFADDAYKDVTLTFTESSLTVEYEEDGFGGMNAEPRGTYYLSNSGSKATPFLQSVYDRVDLAEEYRRGNTEILTYIINDEENALLLRAKDTNAIISEHIVIYNHNSKVLSLIGEVSFNNMRNVREQLKAYNLSDEQVYAVTRKSYYDRYVEVVMARFDNSLSWDEFSLTDEEAFYIVTGIPNSTSIEDNYRDDNNRGSIFIQEVDHADEHEVIIHIYELVRNDETDTHTATSDWLMVDRLTGSVTSMIYGE
jgi:hypothetical protein